MIVTAKKSRPGTMNTGAAHKDYSTSGHSTPSSADTASAAPRANLVPAPVDGGLAMLHGPLMHPDSAPAIWREYGRPEPMPWGSYLDETPLPVHPDGRGPIAVMHDMIEQHRAGVLR